MLIATDIHKKYGELHVLKGVNLEVKKGEILAIMGASGAGKSTLLQILGTLDTPDQGSLSIDQSEISGLSVDALAKFRNRHIGFIFQFHNLLPEFSALENVSIPSYLAGKSKKEVQERAEQLLVRVGLADRLHHRPNQLSGGEQQRTSIARALMNEPSIIFADEPTGNLDSKNANDLHQLFFQLREELHQTFVIVTHNESLGKSTDRCLRMKDGIWEH